MAYDFYLGKTRLPIAPQKLQMKVNGKNKTITLINQGEVNILKKAGLSDISFTALLPNVRYPFASYDGGFKNAAFYFSELEKLKTNTDEKGNFLPFQFIVSRVLPSGKVLYDTNMKVTLEDYTINEDVKQGFDVSVDIKLKEYRAHGTKLAVAISPDSGQGKSYRQETERAFTDPPPRGEYIVAGGDTLSSIAQRYMGDGELYKELYAYNQGVIDLGNIGTGDTKFTIHAGQRLVIP